jgi:uncharacterized protein YjbI with pentapeptide repeats
VANEELLAQLKKGFVHWNQWRIKNTEAEIDFSNADLSNANLYIADLYGADLCSANLSGTDLRVSNLCGADLSDANLRDADLGSADLSNADLRSADLSGTNLCISNLNNADLRSTDLSGTNLSSADLSSADLRNADLRSANLSDANLHSANLNDANLCNADLSGLNLNDANLCNADLSNAILIASQLLESNLTSAVLTGACIQDWNINSATKLDGVICEYVYLKGEWSSEEKKYIFSDRRPSNPDSIFAPGEFAKLFQKALETVDLIFVDGIDWKAFFQSFQELRSQYDDKTLSIQAIEKKSGGAFVIRLEIPPEADKAAIESRAKELYERDRQRLETQYRAELKAKDREIEIYKQQSSDMMEIVKLQASRPINVEVTTVAGEQITNDLRGANIGNFANQLRDNTSQNASQFTQTIGQNADEISRLITALREQVQNLPEEQRNATNIGLDDLEGDLQKPNIEPKRIKQRLIALLMVLGITGTTIANATDFTNNFFELADKFGIPKSELLQHVPSHLLPQSKQR